MKRLVLVTSLLTLILTTCLAQGFSSVDRSPMDMAYYPNNFAHDRESGQEALIRVTYSRPSMKDRVIFGKLVPFGKVWRTGANENTEIKIYQDLMVAGNKLAAGTYSLFTIPNEKDWIVIFNSALDYWGAYSYDEASDVLRVTIPVNKSETSISDFSIGFEQTSSDRAEMNLAWESTLLTVPLQW